jgi:shikimate dehydrogenase
LNGDYSLFPIHPDDKDALRNLLARLRVGDIRGLNVTIPHKQNVIPHLDELTPTARSIGAVNTIYLREGKLIGDNTDAPGFLTDLNHFLANPQSPNHQSPNYQITKSSIILGAGGSARAVVYALLHDGWEVTIAARRMEQAHQLASSFPEHEIHTMHYESLTPLSSPEAFSLLINTTPVGMTPNIAESPLPEDVDFPPHAAIYDLVYNPRETKLVRDACAQGRLATTGLGMLIAQAALAFEIWTGCQPPREIMFEAAGQPAH